MKPIRLSKWMIAATFVMIMLAAVFTIVVYNDQNNVSNLTVKDLQPFMGPDDLPDVVETPEIIDHRGEGGAILWEFKTLDPTEPLSTPALGDMDGDGTLEVVIASAGDAIYCLNPEDGSEFWDHPYTDDEISFLGETDQTSGLDFEPPPLFSSVTVADIDMGSEPEIIVGVKDNALCLRSDGDVHWLKGSTVGYYFSTCGITDLEGDWTGVKDDLEVIMGSDDNANPANGFLEAWHVDGQEIFRRQIETSGEGGLMGCSIACKDIDGSFEDGNEPYEGDETDTELIAANHDRGMRIFERKGELPNGEAKYTQTVAVGTPMVTHQTYTTAAIGNISGDSTCEIIQGVSLGFGECWDGSGFGGPWGGRVVCYNPQGNENWDFMVGQDGTTSGIQSSIAVCDVQCAKNDPGEKELDYEVVFGADNGKVYCLKAMENSAVEMWSYDTGGRVMSSPAVCNIDGDDELEIIVGSDSGKVFCFDGDPSDGNDDGQSIPGDGIAADLLWVADIGNPVGISSPVVADINLDGVLEVVIGDSLGSVWCIDAGGRCVRGQNDWPMFHCDLNKTGFYNPSTTFGVDLYPRRDYSTNPVGIESTIKDVQPGESVTYNITVKNIGVAFGAQATDKIHLAIEGVPEGWRAFLDTPPHQGNHNPDYVMLNVDQTTNITLKVTAPWEGKIGDLAHINITGNSSNDPWAYDEISTITMLNLHIDLDIGFTKEVSQDPMDEYEGYKWDKISPGAEGVYAINVFNRGNVNDTYELQLSGIPDGWDATFIDTGDIRTDVTLMSNIFEDQYTDPIQTTVNIKVECPLDATLGEEAWIKVTATSMESVFSTVEVVQKEDELLLVADQITDVRIICDEPQLFISPNSSVIFELEIENLSNDQIDVVLSYDGLLNGWKIDLADEVQLLIGQKRKVSVTFVAPADAPADLTCVMTISGHIKDRTHLVSTVGLTAIVRHVYDFDVKIIPEQEDVDPGEDVSFIVQVINFGNGKDIITPSPYDIILGWNVTFRQQGFRISVIDLYYHGTVNFTVTMTVPKGTLSGSYLVGLNISGIDNTVIEYVKVIVNQTYSMKVIPYPNNPNAEDPYTIEGTLDPGRIVPFMVEVRNDANGPDTVNLTIEGMGSGGDNWNAWFAAVSNTPDYTRNTKYIDFDEKMTVSNFGADINYLPNSSTVYRMTIHLPTKQKAWVMIYIQAPIDSLANIVKTISITCDSTGGLKDDQVDNKASIALTVLYPDLTFANGISVNGPNEEIQPNDLVTISVSITNVGDIEADNVIVVLKIDGKELKRAVIKRILVDSDQLITFSWKAESGKHQIEIEIDPEDGIIELNDQNRGINNNVKKRDITVGTIWDRPVTIESLQTVILPLFLLLLVVAAIGIATMFYLKKRSQL